MKTTKLSTAKPESVIPFIIDDNKYCSSILKIINYYRINDRQ